MRSLLIYLASSYCTDKTLLFWQSLVLIFPALSPEEERRVPEAAFQPCVPLVRGSPCTRAALPPSAFAPLSALSSPCTQFLSAHPTSLLPDSLACLHASITLGRCHCPVKTRLRYRLQWGPVFPSPSHLFTIFIGHIDMTVTLCSVEEKSRFLRNPVALARKTFLQEKKKCFALLCSECFLNYWLSWSGFQMLLLSPGLFFFLRNKLCSEAQARPRLTSKGRMAGGLRSSLHTPQWDDFAASLDGIDFSSPCVWWPFDLLGPAECVEVTLCRPSPALSKLLAALTSSPLGSLPQDHQDHQEKKLL